MGMIYIAEKCKKPKRKPGWQKAEADYQAWLRGVQSMSSGIKPTTKVVAVKPQQNPLHILRDTSDGIHPRTAKYVQGVAGKAVPRPDIMYRDDPEMLAREIAARARRFNVAPAYNKGGDQFVTEEELMNQLKGNKRRV